VACLLILKLEVAVGADLPAGHQQSRLLGHDRVRMDYPKVDTGDPVRV
jgi:hypothetical protein